MFRLKELRMENGLKRSEFAKAVNIPATTIANYENETRQAPYEVLIVFARFFNVSVDYLLGVEADAQEVSEVKNEYILSQYEKRLLKSFRSSSNTGKNRIIEYAEMWANTDDDK